MQIVLLLEGVASYNDIKEKLHVTAPNRAAGLPPDYRTAPTIGVVPAAVLCNKGTTSSPDTVTTGACKTGPSCPM
jgi:hypothetical protein